MFEDTGHYNEKVIDYARTDLPLLNYDYTVGEALDLILRKGVGEKIIYFYAVDEENHLLGVVPTRRLLITTRDVKIADIMIKKVFKLQESATVFDAVEQFILHRFLALPIVDEDNRILGMVDISLFTDEIINMDEQDNIDHVFEVIGFSLSDIQNASAFKAFSVRFPWLITTITSGMLCALLTGLFAATLSESIVLAFFLTLLLGLGESVSIQTMTVTIQALSVSRPTFRWFFKTVRKELFSSLLLGISCGVIVVLLVLLWHKTLIVALIIGLSITLAIISSCIIGLSIPSFLHAFKLDPKISAGPVTLALADICTLTVYLCLATIIL